MITGSEDYVPHELSAEQAAREEEHRRAQENLLLARRILLPYGGTSIAVHSGRSHLAMGKRWTIAENLGPVADIAWLSPQGQVMVGVPSGPIDVVVNVGSALSSQLARTWDRHGNVETLERVGRPMIGSFVNEFDASKKNVCVYINGEKVLEPARRIVEECGRKQRPIFEPDLDEYGVPKQDAVIIKVVRSRGSAPAILTVEGWGPAGTLHGFRMLLENHSILSELAKFVESKSGSFEVLIVVDGAHAKEVDGQMTMMATGPLYIPDRGIKAIRIEPKEDPGILEAFKTSTLLNANIIDLKTEKKKRQLGRQPHVAFIGLSRLECKSNSLELEPIVEHELEAARLQLEKELGDV